MAKFAAKAIMTIAAQSAVEISRSSMARFAWVWPPNFNFVVRSLVLFATILMMANLYFLILPPATTFTLLFITICPLSFVYIIKSHASLLLTIWRHDLGKFAYVVIASITVARGKVWADQEIRDILQSNPTLFPSAQQALSLYNVLVIVLLEITIVAAIAMLFQLGKYMMSGTFRRPPIGFANGLAMIMVYFYAYMFMSGLTLISDFDFIERFTGRHLNPAEEFIIWSSFVPNTRLGGSFAGAVHEKFCVNLDPSVWVSPFSSREAMPGQVMAVRRLPEPRRRFGRDHEFRLASCENSANPSAGKTQSNGDAASGSRVIP